MDILTNLCAIYYLSILPVCTRPSFIKLEFERLWGGNIQGYRGVHIGKQIPRGQDYTRGANDPPIKCNPKYNMINTHLKTVHQPVIQ